MIAHVFNSSVVSGPETLVIPALARLGEPVHVVFLKESRLQASGDSPADFARKQGLAVHEVTVRSRWDSTAFRELRSLFERLGPRIVHAHDVKASLYALRSRYPAHLVSTHHGTAARPGLRLRLYEEYYVRRVLPSYRAVCCVCETDLKSLRGRGLKTEKLRLHLNGVDRSEVPTSVRHERRAAIRKLWAESAAATSALPMEADSVWIGAVARLSPEKRHDLMLRSLRVLLDRWQGPRLRLLCFGSGSLEARLRELTRDLGLTEHVFWMGYRDTIGAEMAGLDLLLSLSSGEGIPISILEAGWAGTPVFATAVGGIPSVLGENDAGDAKSCGWLIDRDASPREIARTLEHVCTDTAELGARGACFQLRVKRQFSEKAWLKRLREIYGGL